MARRGRCRRDTRAVGRGIVPEETAGSRGGMFPLFGSASSSIWVGRAGYRILRLMCTSLPEPIFKAQALHSKKNDSFERGGVGNISSGSVRKRYVSFGFGAVPVVEQPGFENRSRAWGMHRMIEARERSGGGGL